MEYDVLILGGGSAGYSAADSAQKMGAKVAIIDPGPLGGLCILRGCMPSKAILRSSDIISLMRRAKEFGLFQVDARANLAAINDRKHKLIREFADYRIQQLKDIRFDLYEEKGFFVSPHEVRVGTQTLKSKNIIIATGTVTGRYPIPGLEEAGYITSDEALDLCEMPKSMIVLGAGPVAVELAQFFCRVGVDVSLLQRSAHILSSTDEDLARPVEYRLRDEGIKIYTGTQLKRVSSNGVLRNVHFIQEGEERSVTGEIIFQALGRKPCTEQLNLEAAGLSTNKKGYVSVNEEMRTHIPHIFAVGDVNGLHEVVHIAIQQGKIAAHNAVSPDSPPHQLDNRLKTTVVFTDPHVASVGLTEKECKEKNIPYLVSSYPFDDHGKSLCLGETHGHVKLLCSPDRGEIIGAHIVGPEGGELIHEPIAVMYYRGTVHDLADIPHYHPTLAEIITYPAEDLALQISRGENPNYF